MAQKVAPRTWFTPRQAQFLEVVAQEKHLAASFYLTGGTALAAVYYNHRYSEDLDLFSPQEFSSRDILHLLFRTQKQLKWRHIRRRPEGGSDMYTLIWPNKSTLKLDFMFYYPPLFKGKKILGINIDSLKDIAINKLETIIVRNKLRDYIDLYTILNREEFTFKQVINWHRRKTQFEAEPLVIAKALLKVNQAQDLPRMKVPLSRPKMIRFFERLADDLKPEIFT